ncbi:hypothetical protein D1BOALGB6SA_5906 [Olavius sp. associated proteobacterium Delta 1]|nr:hypothetical protein D1BOALGB6SA_5906 [Olavius sp. associated proteobacterium Delta 1]
MWHKNCFYNQAGITGASRFRERDINQGQALFLSVQSALIDGAYTEYVCLITARIYR